MSDRFPEERRRFLEASELSSLYLSTIVLFELQTGVEKSSFRINAEQRLARFLSLPVEVVKFEHQDARASAAIRANLGRRKQEIGNFDLLIAGQALSRGLTLVTTNHREFSRVEGLLWEDWSR